MTERSNRCRAKSRATTGALSVIGYVGIVVGMVGLAAGVASAHPHDQRPGSLDAGFGNGGVVLTAVQDFSEGTESLLVQEDGKIVVAGLTVTPETAALTLVRYRRDGALDPTFGVGGTSETILERVPLLAGLLQERDGKIVVVGTITIGRPTGNDETVVLARYRRDGQLDETFGENGLVYTSFGVGTVARATGAALQSDGRIVVVGLANTGDGTVSRNLLLRYESNGSLDATFGVGGSVLADFGGAIGQILNAVAIADDGKIVTVGNSKQITSGFNGTVARFDRDGSIDATFATGGAMILRQFGNVSGLGGVAVQHDGRIVVGGGGTADPQSPLNTGMVLRFNADGSSDATFGTGGLVFVPVAPSGTQSGLDGIKIDRCGRIVAAGSIALSTEDTLLLRYDRDGSPDPAFGVDGRVVTAIDGLALQLTSIALEHDGDIAVASAGFPIANPSGSVQHVVISRYEGGGEDRGCGCEGRNGRF